VLLTDEIEAADELVYSEEDELEEASEAVEGADELADKS